MTAARTLALGLDGRVALVTGGSRGIGRATCLALADAGAAVAVHYATNREAAERVAAAIVEAGGRAVALGADLRDPASAARLVEAAGASLGPPDVLVNNAADFTAAPVVEMPDAVWDDTLALNLSAAFRCARACIPGMLARGWGRIVNVSSQAAFTGSANHAHYSAAKAGLLGLTYSLAKELGPARITVNAVVPGRIETDLLAPDVPARLEEWMKQTPLRRLGTPDEVASAIVFLASERASYITGAALQVGGGLVMG